MCALRLPHCSSLGRRLPDLRSRAELSMDPDSFGSRSEIVVFVVQQDLHVRQQICKLGSSG